MFYKELDVVRSTEDKAEKIIMEAEIKAKEIDLETQSQISKIKLDSEKIADEIYFKYLDEGKAIAKYNYDNQMEATEKETKIISMNAEREVSKAIDLIFERIVVNSVNS